MVHEKRGRCSDRPKIRMTWESLPLHPVATSVGESVVHSRSFIKTITFGHSKTSTNSDGVSVRIEGLYDGRRKPFLLSA